MKPSLSRVKLYFNWILGLIESDPRILSFKIIRERFSLEKGFIQISAQLLKNLRLEIFEYYSISKGLIDYRYQLMHPNNQIIARWDIAPHHPEISTHPYHLHYQN